MTARVRTRIRRQPVFAFYVLRSPSRGWTGSHRPCTRMASSRSITHSSIERGLEVGIRPMREERILEGNRAVVLGTPFYIGHWHKGAQDFLPRYREALVEWPVATFAIGPLSSDEQEILESRSQLDEELEKYPWLTPAALEMFGGKYDPSNLSFSHRLLTALPARSIGCRRAMSGTGRRFAPGRAIWLGNFGLLRHNERAQV